MSSPEDCRSASAVDAGYAAQAEIQWEIVEPHITQIPYAYFFFSMMDIFSVYTIMLLIDCLLGQMVPLVPSK